MLNKTKYEMQVPSRHINFILTVKFPPWSRIWGKPKLLTLMKKVTEIWPLLFVLSWHVSNNEPNTEIVFTRKVLDNGYDEQYWLRLDTFEKKHSFLRGTNILSGVIMSRQLSSQRNSRMLRCFKLKQIHCETINLKIKRAVF